jgi:hypothetical protein
MHTKKIIFMGQPSVLACDGNCRKAWGLNNRPRLQLSEDPDDYAYLSDGETDEAPAFPGTREGGCRKPRNPDGMNKWCARECERSALAPTADAVVLRDFSTRRLNQPWKHEGQNVDAPSASQPADLREPVTLAEVLDALNTFNRPRPSEDDGPWEAGRFIRVDHLPAFINIIAAAWFARGAIQAAERERLALWYAEKGFMLDEDDVPGAMRKA